MQKGAKPKSSWAVLPAHGSKQEVMQGMTVLPVRSTKATKSRQSAERWPCHTIHTMLTSCQTIRNFTMPVTACCLHYSTVVTFKFYLSLCAVSAVRSLTVSLFWKVYGFFVSFLSPWFLFCSLSNLWRHYLTSNAGMASPASPTSALAAKRVKYQALGWEGASIEGVASESISKISDGKVQRHEKHAE